MGKQLTPKKKARSGRCSIPSLVKSELAGKSTWSIERQAQHLVDNGFSYSYTGALNVVKKYRGVRRRKG